MNNKQTQRGFSLVEMLVYIAILLIVSTASVTFMISLNDFVSQYRVETALYRSSTSAMEQILVALRQADSYDAIGSVTADADGVLSIANGATSTVIARNTDELELTIDGVVYGNMLADSVDVTSFYVYEYAVGEGNMVRVRLSLTATVNGVTKDITLYGGSVIRGAL